MFLGDDENRRRNSKRSKTKKRMTTTVVTLRTLCLQMILCLSIIMAVFWTEPPEALTITTTTTKNWHSNGNGEERNDLTIHQTELYSYNNDGYHQRNWNDFDKNLELLNDHQLQSLNRTVPIGVAHSQGLLHRGIWIAILRSHHKDNDDDDDDEKELLLVKRAPFLKTCPSSWGLVGEHSEPGEPWEKTAQRALQEEVQLMLGENLLDREVSTKQDTTTMPLSSKSKLTNLLFPNNDNTSILVKSYMPDVDRYELQATALFSIDISYRTSQSLRFDNEVAEIQWIPITKVLQSVYTCNDEIFDLLKIVIQRILLIENEY